MMKMKIFILCTELGNYRYQYSANQYYQVENLPGGGGGGAEKDKYWVV